MLDTFVATLSEDGDAVLTLAGQQLPLAIAREGLEMGTYASDGRILVEPGTADFLRNNFPVGSRVQIVNAAEDARPVPTPRPPSPPPVACPAGARGVAPNCFRVVDPLVEFGDCSGFQVEIGDSCYLFGGDPSSQPDGSVRCDAPTTHTFDNRCYVIAGQRPLRPAGCPVGATLVGGECRVRVNAT